MRDLLLYRPTYSASIMKSLNVLNGTRGLVGSLLCLAMSYWMTWEHDALSAVALFLAGLAFYRVAKR